MSLRITSPAHWSLRTKSIALVLAASTVPVLLACAWAFFEARATMREQTGLVLEARADQIRSELDAFHATHLAQAQELGLDPLVRRFLEAPAQERAALEPQLSQLAAQRLQREPDLLGVALLDSSGLVVFSSLAGGKGIQSGHRGFFRQAMAVDGAIAGDLFLGSALTAAAPLIPYCFSVRGSHSRFVATTASAFDAPQPIMANAA